MENRVLEFLSPGNYRIRKEPLPLVGPDDVLIRTLASGVCMYEVKVFTGQLKVNFPWIGGHETVGTVVDTGNDVKNIKPGTFVTAWPKNARGLASYHTVPIERLVEVGKINTSPEYWISEPIKCAVTSTMHTPFRPGDRVALIGCGYMGLLHLQALPKNWFPIIAAVDVLDERLELAKSFGASHTFNARDKGHDGIKQIVPGGYDVVIEASGSADSLGLATEIVREGGTITLFSFHGPNRIVDAASWHLKGIKVLNTSPMISGKSVEEFYRAVELMKAGFFDQTRLITHRFSFDEIDHAMAIIKERPKDYIKGVFIFP